MSIHGLLAADFVLNPPSKNWLEVIPTISEFNSIPFFWPRDAQALLPGAAKRLLEKQQSSFRRDLEQFQNAYPHVASKDYMHAWFVVSTRAFYQETPQTLAYPWHDRLALLPVADLFNHADTGCEVSYYTDSYTILADRDYLKGDEVCTSYGEHSNDFLLAEYGFLLKDNPHDRIDPNDLVSPEMNTQEIIMLSQMRTLASMSPIFSPANADEMAPHDKDCSEDISGAFDTEQLKKVLAKSLENIKRHHDDVLALSDEDQQYQSLLLERWTQIDQLVRKAIQLSSSKQ
ncbi:hypothetical protein V2A60_004404 [Cordyceps javanica]|uniref:SET domain-containing protein n=1 Tax=Cordyceps javanica TaxID=43265 RepID=A0A545VQX7_9HYPO|nr:SET domain-containing protein [Cordyceps javanica]TQW04109.1 SET domain-containing protein [Cordyceps javanica]